MPRRLSEPSKRCASCGSDDCYPWDVTNYLLLDEYTSECLCDGCCLKMVRDCQWSAHLWLGQRTAPVSLDYYEFEHPVTFTARTQSGPAWLHWDGTMITTIDGRTVYARKNTDTEG